jgi:uncharacterized protein YlbG (UPF0298 family)
VFNPSKTAYGVIAAPYIRLVKRAFFGPGSVDSVAFSEEILCPEETGRTRPAVYLPGQLDRISGGTEHQPVANEITSMLAATYTHAPTIAYHVKQAIITRGSVYAGNLRYFISNGASFSSTREIQHHRHAALATTAVGARYFGHWLRDDCVQFLLADQTGAPICMSSSDFKHKGQYADYFGQDWTPSDSVIVDDLILYQDFAQNSLKRRRYEELTKLISKVLPSHETPDRLVYLKRGQTGVLRAIEDEEALIHDLVKHNFEVVDVADDDVQNIVERLSRAKLVVSMEGSQIAHCTYALSRNSCLLVLEPPDRFTAIHRHWTECVGIHFGFVVGQKGADGYRFSSSEILSTSDNLLKLAAVRAN